MSAAGEGERARVELAVVTGLGFEARILQRAFRRAASADIALMTATALGEAARAAATGLAQEGATLLASFGVAGGLHADMRPGTVVIADAVVRQGKTRLAASAREVARLRLAAPDVVVGTLASAVQPVATMAAKAALARDLRAVAVDMESYAIAEAAAAAGLPFVAVRVISDPAERDIPPAALAALDASGGVKVGAVIAALLRAPGQLGGLMRLARDMAAARRGLDRAATLLLQSGT